jgi:hypothetical protein
VEGSIEEMPLLAAEGWEVFILGRAETRIHFLRPGVRGFHLGPKAWEPYWVIRRKGHPGARSREEWDLRFARLLHSVKKEQDKFDTAKEGLRKEASDWNEKFTNHTNGSFYHRTPKNSLYDSRLGVGRSETLLANSKWSTELAEKLKFENLDEKGTIVFAFLSELASQVSSGARPETETEQDLRLLDLGERHLVELVFSSPATSHYEDNNIECCACKRLLQLSPFRISTVDIRAGPTV